MIVLAGEWIQELLNKITGTPGGLGIGSYGQGISIDNWIGGLPWIDLESLSEYSRSLYGIYRQMLDDIIHGTYDSAKGIPGTYSEAWEQAVSEAWEDIVEQSETVPGEKDKPTDEDEKEKDDPEEGGGDDTDEKPSEDGNHTDYLEQLDNLPAQRINHIIYGSQNLGHDHKWYLLVANLNWEEIKIIIYNAIVNGTESIEDGIITKKWEINGYTVVVRLKQLLDGTINISNAFVE